MNTLPNNPTVLDEAQKVNLVQSIIRFDCNEYNEDEDADYQPDPEVEEEIIQEYQNEAELLKADKAYHEFVETINVDVSQNADDLEDENDTSEFVIDADQIENTEQANNDDNGVDCDSAAYDSTCTETDLEDENIKGPINQEELKLLTQQVPVKVPISSLHANQATYPPFWRIRQALQNVDSEKEADLETDPNYLPLDPPNGETFDEIEARDLQLRHRIVQVKALATSDTSDSSSDSDEDAEEDDIDEEDVQLAEEIKNLKELENLSDQVKGMIDMVEDMSFVEGQHDNETEFGKNINVLGASNYLQSRNVSHPTTIVDAIAKFDEQTYQEEEDVDYYPNENKENEICMQE